MEKRRKSEGGNDLPEAMIQHIQSFMSGKEAAQTTILSKSWYNSWLTRPNLIFDQRDFSTHSDEFSKFSKKTLKRYQDLNLKIDSFKFWMPFKGCQCHSLGNELTIEAIKMGATDISFEIYPTSKFVLPGDVLQSESLTRLSITGCRMEDVKVNCSTLKYLRLCQVLLEGDLFLDIISSCPLIEGLELSECMCGLKNRKKILNLSKRNMGLFELHKLKTLLLERVKLCSMFFSNFPFRFPCLKNLSVHKCSGYNELQIYSQSLELISFVHLWISLKAYFDVPNLRKFCYSGEIIFPLVSFPNSCNWDFDVSISKLYYISDKWFVNLNKLLTNLSLPEVSLYKILMQQRNSVDNLEEVSVEVFDEAVSGWRTISWKSLLRLFSTSRPAKQRIRFHLRRGQH